MNTSRKKHSARSRSHGRFSPLPPRALARGGEGSGVGGVSACSSGSEFAEALEDLPISLRRDDAALTDAARAALRRALGRRLQKRPLVDVHLLRV